VIHDGNPPLDEELERQMDEDLQSLNTTPVTKVPAKTASLQ